MRGLHVQEMLAQGPQPRPRMRPPGCTELRGGGPRTAEAIQHLTQGDWRQRPARFKENPEGSVSVPPGDNRKPRGARSETVHGRLGDVTALVTPRGALSEKRWD